MGEDILHVVPLDDLRPHLLHRTCWCQPRLDPQCDAPIYIHNAADGRELFEALASLRPPNGTVH